MYHVHTSTLSSSTTTTEPVSALSPSVLFPFFQPNSSSSSPSSAPSSPPTSSSHTSPHHHTTTTSSASSCPCHDSQVVPPPVSAPPQFITLPSANPHQSIILPLPQPSPPPAASSASNASSASTSSPATSESDRSAPTKSPLLVFSHGSTQVDTFVPSTQSLQRTLYSWSQLSDYTTKYCWNLPATSTSSTQSSQAAGQPVGHNVSINNTNGRICQGDEVMRCPGHPWVNFSYHIQVKQWQEKKEDALAAATAAAAVTPQPIITQLPTHTSHQTHPHDAMGVKGLEVRVAQPSDILVDGVRRHRGQHTSHSDADSHAGGMFDELDDGDDADEEGNWNELCSTTEDEDDYELTDIDM